MLSDVFRFFDIQADIELNVLREGQTLPELSARAIKELAGLFSSRRPNWVLLQGDTTTAISAAYSAFLCGCRIGHVEAGLRTFDKKSPFPEEMNRRLITALADLNFAPTQRAVAALRAEGVRDDAVYLTGNTIVDALNAASAILDTDPAILPECVLRRPASERFILVTAHRRENFEAGLANICSAICRFLDYARDYHVIFQVHPNPIVKKEVTARLCGHGGVTLIEPQPYDVFLDLMRRSHFILTDSGGIQEEAPALGKPVLVARENTERPEGVEAGCAELVGTTEDSIFGGLVSIATESMKYSRMANVANPYGDGTASRQIVEILSNYKFR